MSLDGAAVIAQLRLSHDRLVRDLEVGSEAMLIEPSACTERSVGRVACHLGSGAEIATITLEAGLAGDQHGVDGDLSCRVEHPRVTTASSISGSGTPIAPGDHRGGKRSGQ